MSPLFDEQVFFMLRSHVTNIKKNNISFTCHTKSKSRKWMGICRFEIKFILLLQFRVTVLWTLREFACVSTKVDSPNELRLAKELQKQPPIGVPRKRCSENMSIFTAEHPCRSAISIKLQANLLKSHVGMDFLL